MRRIAGLALAVLAGFALLYVSRFWIFNLWDRPGLFGWQELRPQGGLLAGWLRGTDAAPFELIIWGAGVFLVLTVLQKLFDRTSGQP